MAQSASSYLADSPPTVVRLECAAHFAALTPQQKRYAHHLSRAAFLGTRVTLRQVSPESEAIYDLIVALHAAVDGDYARLARDTPGVDAADVDHWLDYAAQFLGNCGNYKGFGDSKFVPRIARDRLERLAAVSERTRRLFVAATTTGGGIYDTPEPGHMHLGYPDRGHVSAYYPDSPDITKAEIAAVSAACERAGLLLENTRLRKRQGGGGTDFELLIASATDAPPAADRDLGATDHLDLELDGGKKGRLSLVYGDHKDAMARIAAEVGRAEHEALNETERRMLGHYGRSFQLGSIEAFKESQRWWIRDKGPAVESDLGFVETYRDPHGVRGEWEGFVAMVNAERTRAFGALVAAASTYIARLPWPRAFEKDAFLSPDFTSLEVLSFAGSGIPAGINIPNYDDIRQHLGFKNVSLGNVLSAAAPHEPIPFVRAADEPVYRAHRDAAFEVQVGIHELLGHGTGKLLQETAPGVFNFDRAAPPVSPISGRPVTTWYGPGQTWASVFGAVAASYEECRAECVAMALLCEFDLLRLFGHGDGRPDVDGPAGDVLYVGYLQMARAGLAALEYWDPRSRKWGQAHMQARYSILRTFLAAGDGDFCRLVSVPAPDGGDGDDLEIHLDRGRILSHGRPAVEAYLQKLHVYKATADVAAGTALYDDVTSVGPWWADHVRPLVLRKKLPRKVFVQANTRLDERTGDVSLVEYEPTVHGLIRSYVEREV